MAVLQLENRLIAMLDVLGFSSQIECNQKLVEIADQYSRLIAEAKNQAFSPKTLLGSPEQAPSNFAVGEFVFDNVILVSEELSPKSVGNFIFALIHIMETFYTARFPLRGSISIGNYYSNDASGIFLSNAFKRLSISEQSQDWSGCVVLPEAEAAVLENLLGPINSREQPNRSCALLRYTVPAKCNTLKMGELYCLNWAYLLSQDELDFGLKFLSVNQVKYRETLNFIDYLKTLPDPAQHLESQFLPAVCMRSMKGRSCMRIKFEDQHGNATNPGCPIQINII